MVPLKLLSDDNKGDSRKAMSSFRRNRPFTLSSGTGKLQFLLCKDQLTDRVILDEAHNIKERSTNAAKAAFALDAQYKWCLSGTPLQNRVGELYSLVRFLGADPFSHYFCKQCDCKSLHWQVSSTSFLDD